MRVVCFNTCLVCLFAILSRGYSSSSHAFLAMSMLPLASYATSIVASTQIFYVTPGVDEDIVLEGFTLPREPRQKKKISYSSTDNVENGNLYHPSYNYCRGRGHSKRGDEIIGASDVQCTKKASFLYSFPSDRVRPKNSELDRFQYVAKNSQGISCPGVVLLVDATDPLIVASTFDFNSEDWSISSNGAESSSQWDRSSMGPHLNRYIHGTDNRIDVNAMGSDTEQWAFVAPSKFLGSQVRGGMAVSYGGKLSFVLSSAAGDFSKLNHGHDGTSGSLPVVRIECPSCRNEGPGRTDRGIQLIYPMSALSSYFDGTTTTIEIDLSESSGWLKDSENSNVQWQAPSQNEFVQVLKRFSTLEILGDYTRYYESVILDRVRIEPGPTGVVLPDDSHEFLHFEDACSSS
jgi:hypothetical protein